MIRVLRRTVFVITGLALWFGVLVANYGLTATCLAFGILAAAAGLGSLIYLFAKPHTRPQHRR